MEDKKKVMVIGHVGYGSIGKTAIEKAFGDVTLKDCHVPKIAVIEKDEPFFTIEVNGVKYKRIDRSSPNRDKSEKFSKLMAMANALTITAGYSGGGSDYERKRPHVDIVDEYGLIELKQSKLCRNDRDWVIAQFEYNYKKLA